MILTIDTGNTHTVLGIWENNGLLNSVRVSTVANRTASEWSWIINAWLGGIGKPEGISAAIFSSVVPVVDEVLIETFKLLKIEKILQVNNKMIFPFQWDRENYPNLGADRLANAAAGVALFGKNLIIADFGTAITFCLIIEGVYQGGVIVPGIQTSLKSLSEKASNLPQIYFKKKDQILGKDTRSSIESGIYYGYKGVCREILGELGYIYQKHFENTPLVSIATGGVASDLGFIHEFFNVVDPDLTLKGLLHIYKLNV